MKKVGIITWHYIDNYGSALQAYALQETVEKFGFHAQIIHYCKDAYISGLKRSFKYFPIALKLKRKLINSKRERKFYSFHYNYFNLTKLYSTYEELKHSKESHDIYICGSDQIWSSNLLDSVYLLNFVKKDCRKVSYAPSLVIDDFIECQKELMVKYLPEFDFLSVRENKGAEIIKKITKLNAEVVLDPTFLLTAEDWDSIMIPPLINEKYILCYFLGQNTQHREWVRELQRKYGYKICTLPFNIEDMRFGDITEKNAGPREFLGLLKNAEIICTDSFHGVALSINYNKSFVVFERFKTNEALNQNDRIYNILSKLNLTDRIVADKNYIENIDMDINYNSVNELLIKERKASLYFLERALI